MGWCFPDVYKRQLYTHAPVSSQQTIGVDLAFCIDVSNSMAARDVKPDRIGDVYKRQLQTILLG